MRFFSAFVLLLVLFSLPVVFAQEVAENAEGSDEQEHEEEDGLSSASALVQSLVVIIREGVEAILIIAAISAYLVVSKNSDKLKHVYIGTGLAILASIVTAFLIDQIFHFGDAQAEILEGLTLLTAAAVLLYVTNWMLAKAHVIKWQKYIKGKVDSAVKQENSFALATVAFLAVYREGFETVLFLKALLLQTNAPQDILFGIILGGVILVGVFIAIMKLGLRIPINTFFMATSVLIFFFALSFVGTGIHELQEAHVLPETELEGLPKISLVGLYPTIETILAQSLVLALGTILAYIHIFRHHDLAKEKVAAN